MGKPKRQRTAALHDAGAKVSMGWISRQRLECAKFASAFGSVASSLSVLKSAGKPEHSKRFARSGAPEVRVVTLGDPPEVLGSYRPESASLLMPSPPRYRGSYTNDSYVGIALLFWRLLSSAAVTIQFVGFQTYLPPWSM